MASSLRIRIFEKLRTQIIFANMVIDDDFGARPSSQDFCHGTELSPSTCVQNNEAIAKNVFRSNVFADHLNTLRRIQKSKDRWRLMTVHDRVLFAHGLENSSHPEFAAQRIAIRPNVAGQHKIIVAANQRNQGIPI